MRFKNDLEHFTFELQCTLFNCDYTDKQILNLVNRVLKNRAVRFKLKREKNSV